MNNILQTGIFLTLSIWVDKFKPINLSTIKHYTANGVNCDILIANCKPQIPSLKFQNLLSRVVKTMTLSCFRLGIWNLEFGTWNFLKCTILSRFDYSL